MSFDLAREGEAFVSLADPWHRPIDEHQLEVLRMLAAEVVKAPEDLADALDRLGGGQPGDEGRRTVDRVQQAKAFLRERVEDVVLAREVPVNGGRAVLNLLGDFPD